MSDQTKGLCPKCGQRASWVSSKVEARSLLPVPHQVERYVKFTRWQCYSVQAHNGEYREPWE